MEISKKIRAIIKHRNLTLMQVAKLLNIPYSTLSMRIKRNKFSTEDIEQISKVLNYDLRIDFIDKRTGRIIE